MKLKYTLFLTLLALLFSVNHMNAQNQNEMKSFDPAFAHVVYFWLHNPDNVSDRQDFEAARQWFGQPGCRHLRRPAIADVGCSRGPAQRGGGGCGQEWGAHGARPSVQCWWNQQDMARAEAPGRAAVSPQAAVVISQHV